MIQYKKDTATQSVHTDILSVSKTVFRTVCDRYQDLPVKFSDQYTCDMAWVLGDCDDFEEMLMALFQHIIITDNSSLSEMILAVAANESKVQISICNNGRTPASGVFEIIADSIANGNWISSERGLRRAFEIINKYGGDVRLVRTGIPYHQLLIEFPIAHATKD